MVTVSTGGTTWNTNAGNKTVTFTPSVGDVLVAVCANSGRTTAQPPTVTDNNSSGTYDRIAVSSTKNTSADSMWVFVRTQPIPAASSTIVTMTQASDSGGGLCVVRLGGMSRFGLQAVRQAKAQNNQAAGTPSITLDNAPLGNGGLVGAVFTTSNSTNNTSQPAGWSEQTDLGYTTPTSGLEVATNGLGDTNNPVAWLAATPSAFGSIVVEFDGNGEAWSPINKIQLPQLLAH